MDDVETGDATSLRSRRFGRASFGSALVVLMITSAIMQYTLGVLGPVLIERFDISRTQLGFMTTMLFIVGSSGSPVAGRLIDRVGAHRVLPLPFIATIIGFIGLAMAPRYGAALVAVAIAGSGMAFANPLSNKLVALHVPKGHQGLLMGIKQSGVQVGAVIAGVSMPAAVLAFGPVGAFATTAGVLVLGLVAVQVIIPADPLIPPQPPGRPAEASATEGPATEGPAAEGPAAEGPASSDEDPHTPVDAELPLAPGALLWWIGGYALLMGSGIASIYAYLPLFAFDELGLSVSRAGVLASLIGLIGVASRILWGAASERLGHPSIVLTILAGTAVAAQSLIWASPLLGVWAIWAAAVVLGGSAVAWNVVAMLAVVKVLGPAAAGKNSGFVQFGFFSGFAIGPIGFGLLTDLTDTYTVGWAAVTACFALACLVAGRWAVLTRRLPDAASR